MRDERVLRAQVREAMKADSLPDGRPERMWGGPGSGAPCAVCGGSVGQQEMEFELQFSATEEGSGSYHAHVRCFAAWELERRSGGLSDHKLPRTDDDGIMSREHDRKNRGEGTG